MKIIFTQEEALAMHKSAIAFAAMIKEVKPHTDEAELVEQMMGTPMFNEDGTITVEIDPSVSIALSQSMELVCDTVKPFLKPAITVISGLGENMKGIWKDVKSTTLVNGVDQEQAAYDRKWVSVSLMCVDENGTLTGDTVKLVIDRKHKLAPMFTQWFAGENDPTRIRLPLHEQGGNAYIGSTAGFANQFTTDSGEASVINLRDEADDLRYEFPRIVHADGETQRLRSVDLLDGAFVWDITYKS